MLGDTASISDITPETTGAATLSSVGVTNGATVGGTLGVVESVVNLGTIIAGTIGLESGIYLGGAGGNITNGAADATGALVATALHDGSLKRDDVAAMRRAGQPSDSR